MTAILVYLVVVAIPLMVRVLWCLTRAPSPGKVSPDAAMGTDATHIPGARWTTPSDYLHTTFLDDDYD